MSRYTVSNCHALRLVPISILTRFAVVGSRVYLRRVGDASGSGAIPGTVKVATAADDGGRVKLKITFERSYVTPAVADELERLKRSRLVASYTDERGRARVAGSPNWPLSLDYVDEGGVFRVTVEGESLGMAGFLAD